MTRIYAACLASYNAGRLHGAWINADQDASSIQAEISAMLKASPCPNVTRADYRCRDCHHEWAHDVSSYQPAPDTCPDCKSSNIAHGAPYPSAEEFAIHDHEGFAGLLSEYTPIDEVVWTAEALKEHGSKYAGLRKVGYNHEDAVQKVEEDYQGEYDSLADWAEQYLEDTGLFHRLRHDSPLRTYFDFEQYARDALLGGDIMTVEADSGCGAVHVFANH